MTRLRPETPGLWTSLTDHITPSLPRIVAGAVLLDGHIGHVYRVAGGGYLGRGTARTVTVLPDGTVLTARALQKSAARR